MRMKKATQMPAVRRTATLGLLCALAVALSFLEGWLPVLPVPGAKLGLSNIVTMYTLSVMGLPAALSVSVVKGLFALLRGGTACLMSLSGALLSTLIMAAVLPLYKRMLSFVGIGIAGAVGHNTAQLGVAMLLMDSSLVYYAPWLLLMALLAGLLTGMVLNVVMPALGRLTGKMRCK